MKGISIRPLQRADAHRVAELAADPRIAATTLTIPHPYALHDAEVWLERSTADRWTRGVTLEGALIGVVALALAPGAYRGSLSYWIGVPSWGRGVATAAARLLLREAFETLPLVRAEALVFPSNVASMRVLEKCGFQREGLLRRYALHRGVPVDLTMFSLLRVEWRSFVD